MYVRVANVWFKGVVAWPLCECGLIERVYGKRVCVCVRVRVDMVRLCVAAVYVGGHSVCVCPRRVCVCDQCVCVCVRGQYVDARVANVCVWPSYVCVCVNRMGGAKLCVRVCVCVRVASKCERVG